MSWSDRRRPPPPDGLRWYPLGPRPGALVARRQAWMTAAHGHDHRWIQCATGELSRRSVSRSLAVSLAVKRRSGGCGGPLARTSRNALTSTCLAERVGFEPTVTCATHDFQSCRFGRSRTPPRMVKPPNTVVWWLSSRRRVRRLGPAQRRHREPESGPDGSSSQRTATCAAVSLAAALDAGDSPRPGEGRCDDAGAWIGHGSRSPPFRRRWPRPAPHRLARRDARRALSVPLPALPAPTLRGGARPGTCHRGAP